MQEGTNPQGTAAEGKHGEIREVDKFMKPISAHCWSIVFVVYYPPLSQPAAGRSPEADVEVVDGRAGRD
jgi:hypothetical protein